MLSKLSGKLGKAHAVILLCMTSIPVMLRTEFERDDFDQMCLFTGAAVKKTKLGEHVIPRWLIDDYELNSRHIEMGWPGSTAEIKKFRTRADPVANGIFGNLENLVKQGETSLDHLHLWQKKISVGMTLCHWRMAQNQHHPQAPSNFDTRRLVYALKDFQEDFRKFSDEKFVPRNGSTLVLPTSVPNGWLAHVVGSVDQSGGEVDALMPYGFVAVTHQNRLIVSALYDHKHEFESSCLATDWRTQNLEKCSSALSVAAALSLAFAKFVFKARVETFGAEGEGLESMVKGIAYQLGLEIDPLNQRYLPRRPG